MFANDLIAYHTAIGFQKGSVLIKMYYNPTSLLVPAFPASMNHPLCVEGEDCSKASFLHPKLDISVRLSRPRDWRFPAPESVIKSPVFVCTIDVGMFQCYSILCEQNANVSPGDSPHVFPGVLLFVYPLFVNIIPK